LTPCELSPALIVLDKKIESRKSPDHSKLVVRPVASTAFCDSTSSLIHEMAGELRTGARLSFKRTSTPAGTTDFQIAGLSGPRALSFQSVWADLRVRVLVMLRDALEALTSDRGLWIFQHVARAPASERLVHQCFLGMHA